MSTLSKKISDMFSSQKGSQLYDRICSYAEKNNMLSRIDKGVLVGFSGGADSGLLLSFLHEYKKISGKSFSIFAVHVNHGIRGGEAERDARFSKDFCDALSVDFQSVDIDIPKLASENKIGLEEAARNERYFIFDKIILSRNDLCAIAVAHNATDNAETVLFNILRGAGLSGVIGIKPTRDNIIRPLLDVSKEEIIDIMNCYDIPYVIDSTNLSNDYSRNYIRNEILPRLKRLTPYPEISFSRMTRNLSYDLDFIDSEAEKVTRKIDPDAIDVSVLRNLHPSVFARVMNDLVFKKTGAYPTAKHINAIRDMLCDDNFSVALSGNYNFVCNHGICYFVAKDILNPIKDVIFRLNRGENKIDGTNLTVYVGEVKKSFLNVYNFSIKVDIPSAIIDDGLHLRFKRDGDAYKYAGITHKIKKVFNDREIPVFKREFIPIICDNEGIIFIPGLPLCDRLKKTNSDEKASLTLCYSELSGETEIELYTLSK